MAANTCPHVGTAACLCICDNQAEMGMCSYLVVPLLPIINEKEPYTLFFLYPAGVTNGQEWVGEDQHALYHLCQLHCQRHQKTGSH